MAKPSKKKKVTKTSENPYEPEQQSVEASHQAPEATIDEPPLVDHNVDADPMDVDATINPPSPAKPASPAKPPSPVKHTEYKAGDDDVAITGHGYTTPGQPTD